MCSQFKCESTPLIGNSLHHRNATSDHAFCISCVHSVFEGLGFKFFTHSSWCSALEADSRNFQVQAPTFKVCATQSPSFCCVFFASVTCAVCSLFFNVSDLSEICNLYSVNVDAVVM